MAEGEEPNRTLDFLSADFNALEALTVPRDRVQLPVPNAPIYDNMTWFVETEDGIFPRERAKKKVVATDPAPSTSGTAARAKFSGKLTWKNTNAPAPESGDPFSPKDSVAKTHMYKNVLINMDTAVGPLALLKKCMDEKLRAKVTIRGAVSIRGFCIGFIEAFDKHMNLVLKDVYETWKRPRKKHRKTISIETSNEEKRGEKSDNEESIGNTAALHKYAENGPPGDRSVCYPIARWVVKRRTKKKDVCERHIHQLLIRGEQIVCVMLDR